MGGWGSPQSHLSSLWILSTKNLIIWRNPDNMRAGKRGIILVGLFKSSETSRVKFHCRGVEIPISSCFQLNVCTMFEDTLILEEITCSSVVCLSVVCLFTKYKCMTLKSNYASRKRNTIQLYEKNTLSYF